MFQKEKTRFEIHKMNKNLIRLIKIIAFAGIIYLIYVMVKSRDSVFILRNLLVGLGVEEILLILLVFVLQFANWGIEALKFKVILKQKVFIGFTEALKAVYIGNASSIFTPDRLGNFIGRAFYLRNINKVVVTSASMLGNLAQLLSTLIFAFIAMVLFIYTNNEIAAVYVNPKLILLLVVVLNLIVGGIFCYPRLAIFIVLRIKWLKKHRRNFLFITKFSNTELCVFLGLALLRYLIFIIQFYFLLFVFGIDLPIVELFIFIGLMYFVTTLVPSPFLGNLGTREITAVYLLALYQQPESILVASLAIWLINVIFPAVLGFVLAFNMNLYKKDL